MPGRRLSAADLDHFETQLRTMLGVLNGDIDRLQALAVGDGDRAENRGDDGKIYSIEFSLELMQHDASTKREIIEALGRIEANSYGRCEVCEAWLLKDRLRAMPHARNCVGCQRESETKGP
jgi:DnaK suppressor protein